MLGKVSRNGRKNENKRENGCNKGFFFKDNIFKNTKLFQYEYNASYITC